MQGHSGGNKYCLILNRPLLGTPNFIFRLYHIGTCYIHLFSKYLLVRLIPAIAI